MTSDGGDHAMLARIEKRLDLLARLMLGNGDVGLAEQVRANRREIERLRNSIDMALRGDKEDPGVTKARLRLIGEIVVAVSAISAVVLHFLGG